MKTLNLKDCHTWHVRLNGMKLWIMPVICILLFSCSGEERMLKKFESRLNAREYACASSYIYDGDMPSFSFFANGLLEQNPNLMIKLASCSSVMVDGADALSTRFELVNASQQVRNYFKNIGYQLSPQDVFQDTILIRQTNEGKKLSFNWGLDSQDENEYMLAHIVGEDIENMSIRVSPNTSAKVIGKLKKGDDIIIDNNGDEQEWVHCYYINAKGKIIDGYILNNELGKTTSSFFSLGVFDSMTLLVAVIIFVVICVFFVFGSSLFSMIAVGIPGGGIIIVVGCILGLLYVAYQLLEKILFELFIINLPY